MVYIDNQSLFLNFPFSFCSFNFFSNCLVLIKKMKVIDKINKAEKEGRPFWSFEYFPPKTPQVQYHHAVKTK